LTVLLNFCYFLLNGGLSIISLNLHDDDDDDDDDYKQHVGLQIFHHCLIICCRTFSSPISYQSIIQLINQSINQSVSQSINHLLYLFRWRTV